MTALAWVVVGTWLLLTALAQFPGRAPRRIRVMDYLGIIPAWTFFAPNPGISDPVLIGRDKIAPDDWTPWQIVWREENRRFRLLWRPDKRVSKLIADCGSQLPKSKPSPGVAYSFPYLAVGLIAESSMRHDFRAIAWQFAVVDIAAWHAHPDPSVLAWFRSAELDIEQEAPPWILARPSYCAHSSPQSEHSWTSPNTSRHES